jgi:F-type H+-transporting ATPase subunit gamma
VSDGLAALRRKINGAADLQAVVRTMKALAASSIVDYERSVLALADYDRMVSFGLGACFRQARAVSPAVRKRSVASASEPIVVIVFGSDQGLVGPLNEVITEHAVRILADLPGAPQVLAVGERVDACLKDAGLDVLGTYAVPTSVESIAPLVARIEIDSEIRRTKTGMSQVHVFHNRPMAASLYEPVGQRLLPLDTEWQLGLAAMPWPGKILPEVLDHSPTTLRALIREYLFISLFRACAESLASENASRLAAMERADRNIKDLLAQLRGRFHQQRQDAIDDELFDVTAGYEALARS